MAHLARLPAPSRSPLCHIQDHTKSSGSNQICQRKRNTRKENKKKQKKAQDNPGQSKEHMRNKKKNEGQASNGRQHLGTCTQ
jgi:hypothetical protein